MASGHAPHLDALFIRAAHKTSVCSLELAMGATIECFEPYAMVPRQPLTIMRATYHFADGANCRQGLDIVFAEAGKAAVDALCSTCKNGIVVWQVETYPTWMH